MELEPLKRLSEFYGADTTLTVSEYLDTLNEGLTLFRAKVTGEVGRVTVSRPGHIYFSLKDKRGGSMLDCVMWRYNYELYGVRLKEGLEVILSGHPNVYKPRGRMSFMVDAVELVGEGVLKKAYEELKDKLTKEGLFDESRKRQLPEYPNRIGVITSMSGAVIHDFVNNLGMYGFRVQMMDSPVEGQEAVKGLIGAVRSFKARNIEALVIIRGGGSFESLMAFNNDTLVREIAGFPVPVVAGIGHHQDVPLVALAADVMESTPTATAKVLNQSWDQAGLLIERCRVKIESVYSQALVKAGDMEKYRRKIESVYTQALIESSHKLSVSEDKTDFYLTSIINIYEDTVSRLTMSVMKMHSSLILKRRSIETQGGEIQRGFSTMLSATRSGMENSWSLTIRPGFKGFLGLLASKLQLVEQGISINDPRRQLALGYSIARRRGKVVRSIEEVSEGDKLEVQVTDGKIMSRVEGKMREATSNEQDEGKGQP